MTSFQGMAQKGVLRNSPLSPNYGQNMKMPMKTAPGLSQGPAAAKPTTAPVKALNPKPAGTTKTAARHGHLGTGLRSLLSGTAGLLGQGAKAGAKWVGDMWKSKNAPMVQQAAQQPKSVLMGMATERAKRDAAKAGKMKPPGGQPGGPKL